MKTEYTVLLITIFSMLFVSCEDKLDIDQMGVLSVEGYYMTDEHAKEALGAVYSSWATNFLSFDYFNKPLLADDMYNGGNGPTDNAENQGFAQAFYNAQSENIKGMYSGYYSTIYRANLVIDHFKGDAADSDVKRQALAEARFFRAWCYYELVSLWETPPLITSVLQPSEYRQPNAPEETVWAFIEAELNEIINSGYLTEKNGPDDPQAGVRPTKQTAQAYLGKVLLFQGKYSEALTQFKAVISSGKYKLAEDDQYANMWHLKGNYSPEYLLSNNTVLDAANGYNVPALFTIVTNWLWGNTELKVYDKAKYDAGNYGLMTTGGYGFHNPTKKVCEAMEALEGKNGFRYNLTVKSYDKMVDEMGILLNNSQIFAMEGWYRYKWLLKEEEHSPIHFWVGAAVNFPALRYAEVLLMAAETGFKTGDADALTWFNAVRSRAKAPQAAALDMAAIQNEFFIETAFEGHRFQDLRRWDRNGDIDMVSVLKDKGKELVFFTTTPPTGSEEYPRVRTSMTNASWVYSSSNPQSRAGFDAYEKVLPFPQSALEVNPNLVQHPGWDLVN